MKKAGPRSADQSNVPLAQIRDAILHRNLGFILSTFFPDRTPRLSDAFRYESELWDFKGACPGHGQTNASIWAEIAADVLAFHNTEGGLLFFGIDDVRYSYAGTTTSMDAKQFNDKIRRYTGDKFWGELFQVLSVLPITRRFAYAELQREPGLEQALRRALSTWYEGADIADPEKRRVMIEIRRGTRDVDTLVVDAGKQLRELGRFGEAEDLLRQGVQRNPQSWRAAYELGDFYKFEKKTARALEYYAKAAALAPKKGRDRALIFREYGILLRDSGSPNALADATSALETALFETPNDHICIYVLAQVLVRREMYRKAIPLLETLVGSADLKARRNAYPLLKRSYERIGEVVKLGELRTRAAAEGNKL